MKIKLVSMLCFLVIIFCSSAWALQEPTKLSSDGRIEVVPYESYNVVSINGTTFTTTQITFGKDEFIENVQNGDLGAWTVSISANIPYMMFVKPTAYNSKTNMTVVTNKHTYYFNLISNAQGVDDQKEATYAIHFIYPEEEREKVQKQILDREQQQQAELSAFQNPADYHWDYSFNGDESIVPLNVFDDGKFTYMQLQPNQPMPAVFAVTSPNGNESVVNYRQDGQYLVVEQVAPQFTLRLGKDHVATIFNNKLIKKLQSSGYSQ